MPHYSNGIEAKIGDSVIGKLYNTENIRAGIIVSITPDVETCNAQVQFTVAVPVEESGHVATPRMTIFDQPGDGTANPRCRRVRTRSHGYDGPWFVMFECADYCAINELTKIG
jgi:hypothetical protein